MAEEFDSPTALAELEQIYRTAPIGLCFVDREYRYVRINEHLAAINGKPAKEHIGRTLREMIPEIADMVQPIFRRVFETGEHEIDVELRGVTEAVPRMERPYVVSFFPVFREDRVTGVTAMVEDISEQEIIKRKLQRGDQILRQVHDAVITTDMEGLVRTWNDAAERIYGYTATEVIGQHIAFLDFPEDAPTREDRVMRPLLKNGSHEVLLRNRTKDGREIFIELRMSLLQDESGAPVGLIGCSNNVTERKRLQGELLKATTSEQRRIGQELHDVTGQELTGLRYLSHTLVRTLTKESSTAVDQAIKIEEGLSRALDQVREMARGLVPVEVDAEGLMAALTTLASNVSAIDGITCSFVCGEPIPIRDNEMATQLYRIAQEGVTNAVKHGRVKRIRVVLTQGRNVLKLRIADDGVGLKPAAPPFGLGLRIMAFRAEMIGGTLDIAPGPASGTEITCTVPAPV